jgi:hypothetical protein
MPSKWFFKVYSFNTRKIEIRYDVDLCFSFKTNL